MNTAKYPLLIAGFYSDQNGSPETFTAIGAGTRKSWTNSIAQARGDMVALDVVPTVAFTSSTSLQAIFDVNVSGTAVIQQATLVNYQPGSFARSYELTQLRQPAGQTIGLTVVGQTGNTQGAALHVYHENNCATPAIIAARNKSILKQRTLEIGGTLLGGSKVAKFANQFTIPKSMGNVVGLQLLINDDTDGDNTAKTICSVSMGGTDIFQNVIGSIFNAQSARPGLIFPILIRGGETFNVTADTSAVAIGDPLYIRLKFYFDEDIEGTKQYDLAPCTP